MRCAVLLVVAASAFGQSKPPAIEPPPVIQLFPKDGSKPLQIPMQKFSALVFAPKVCAIPLLNFLPQHFESKMPVQKPQTTHEPEVKVPAPACDSKLFQNK